MDRMPYIAPLIPHKRPEDTMVVVAMSGGVDSATVAALLHKQKYKVIGVTLQLYPDGDALVKKKTCCAGIDMRDASQVADKLGFPHYSLDYEDVFKKEVIDNFVESYSKGETPIPCITCNQTVKFRDLWKVAKDLGADALATGHYVRRVAGEQRAELHRGMDDKKDQSYFLFSTTQEQLEFIHFPLGSFCKEETRSLARMLGVDIADKKESQDICFVQSGSYSDLVRKLKPEMIKSGVIEHIDGTVIGQHEGIINFTVGQRKGLKIASQDPLYVIKIDATQHKVYVGPRSALEATCFTVHKINWLSPVLQPGMSKEISVRIRSSHAPVPAMITATEAGEVHVTSREMLDSITPGQACVFYDKERVLGGGFISAE